VLSISRSGSRPTRPNDYFNDSFYMFDGECIDEMLTWFTIITGGLVSLGKPISNDQNV